MYNSCRDSAGRPVKSLHSDLLKIHMKVSVFTLDSERARPSSGLSENQSGFIIFTIQIVKQICKYTNTQKHKYINTQILIHKYTNTNTICVVCSKERVVSRAFS